MLENKTAEEIIHGNKPEIIDSFASNPKNQIDDQAQKLDVGSTVIPQLPFQVTTSFEDQFHDFYSGQVLSPSIKENPQTVGTFESIGKGFAKMNDFALMANNENKDNPLFESVPPNWKPSDEVENFANIPNAYQGYLLAANGPKDSKRRYFNVLEMMRNEERYQNGSMFSHATGMLLGGALSPSTWIPLGAEVRAASISTRLLEDIPRILPGITAGAAAHEAVVETNKAGGNLGDFATDTLRDTVMGIAFMGTAMGLGHGYTAGKLWDAKRYINLTGKDIDIVPLLAEDGSILKFEAKSNSASAAEVSFAQDYANSRMAQEGLFGVPIIGDLVGKGASKINPIIRGLNSRFDGVRAFWNGAADHGIATERNVKGVASPDKFEVNMGMLAGDNKQMINWLKGMHLERNGIDPSKRIIAGMQDIRKKWKDSGYVSKEKFTNEIEGVLLNEKPHENAAVNEAAAAIREKYDTSWSEFRKAYDLPETWLPPKTARGFVSRVYDLNYLKQNENKWMETVVPWMKKSDEMIKSRMLPIRDAADQVLAAQEAHTQLLKEVNIPQPSDADLVKEQQLRDTVKPIKERLSTAKAAYTKAKKDITREKHLQRIEAINAELKPHTDALDQHLNTIYSDDIQVKKSSNELEALKLRKKSLEEKLQNELRSDENLLIHVDDISALSANEANQLKSILKPSQDLERDLNTQKQAIEEIKKKISRSEQASKKGKTVETGQKHADMAEQHRLAFEQEQIKLKDLQDKYDQAIEDLQEQAHNKSIDSRFYRKIKNSERYEFKNPNERLKLRDAYESDFHIEQAAKNYYNAIMRQSPEETISGVMDSLLGRGGTAGTDTTKARSILLPDTLMYDANFLSKELGVNVANYRNFLGRRTFMKNIYRDVSIEGGPEELIANVAKQFEAEKQVLNKKKAVYEAKEKKGKLTKKDESEVKKINKQLYSLDKAFSSDIKDMSLAFDKMMGKTQGSEALRRNTAILRSFAVAVKMGATPLTMVTDLMAIPMKHGIWPFISDGLMPILKGAIHQLKNSKEPNALENAGHANLGLNHVLAGFTDRNYAGSAQPYSPMGSSLVNGMERMAHIANNLAGTNQIENFFQQITASVVQSKVMKYLMDYKAGTLSEKNLQKLLVYGVDPEKWADRMIAGWKGAGSDANGLGGFQSWFWKWGDHEASNKMADTVYRGVKDTIIRRGMFDAPFALDDPILGTMFMFKGWVLASMTRYLAPLMQRPDSEKLIGTVLMLAAGSMVTPLRRLVKGEEPFQDDDNMFWNAAVDGGVFSSITDTLEDVNVLMGGALLKDVKNDRYKDRTITGMLAGPIGGMGQDLSQIVKMMATGNYNQNDVNKMARLIPFAQTWYLRGLSNKMVESMSLPKTYGQAEARNR